MKTHEDYLDQLIDLGFMPADDDERLFPAWVSEPHRAADRVAIAYTSQRNIVLLDEVVSDERWSVTVTTPNGAYIAEHSFGMTATGATLMLGYLAAAVTL